jgi:hypothetical protein
MIMKKILKRVLFLKVMLFFNTSLFAPALPAIPILKDSPVDPFSNLIYAIGMVETGLDTIAYNPLEEAIGYFQIRPVRLEDYNRRTGNRYSMKDLYNYSISEKIFKYYAAQIGPYDFETIAKSWNGSGIMTIDYWNRVKMHL